MGIPWLDILGVVKYITDARHCKGKFFIENGRTKYKMSFPNSAIYTIINFVCIIHKKTSIVIFCWEDMKRWCLLKGYYFLESE